MLDVILTHMHGTLHANRSGSGRIGLWARTWRLERGRTEMTQRFRMSLLATGAAAVLALAACSSSGGRQSEEESGPAGTANTPRMTVAFITHSGPGDTFWDLVRKGAEDAAKKDNVDLQYQADPDGPGQANLVQSAVDKKVDGIAVRVGNPPAM
jgi:simple sugar transport system substrate-binding protein